jgi:hypothetical protein
MVSGIDTQEFRVSVLCRALSQTQLPVKIEFPGSKSRVVLAK